jgi:hypothetical protein
MESLLSALETAVGDGEWTSHIVNPFQPAQPLPWLATLDEGINKRTRDGDIKKSYIFIHRMALLQSQQHEDPRV